MSKQIESRLATQSDLNNIFLIISACATRLKDRNLNDWSRYYTVERLKEKIEKQNGYVFSVDNVDMGVVFVSSDDLYYYSETDLSKFAQPKSKGLYIGTLAIKPDFQHQGYASQIIDFCKNLAKEKNIKYLRLDCNGSDESLVEFYKKRGFEVKSAMEKETEYLLLEIKI